MDTSGCGPSCSQPPEGEDWHVAPGDEMVVLPPSKGASAVVFKFATEIGIADPCTEEEWADAEEWALATAGGSSGGVVASSAASAPPPASTVVGTVGGAQTAASTPSSTGDPSSIRSHVVKRPGGMLLERCALSEIRESCPERGKVARDLALLAMYRGDGCGPDPYISKLNGWQVLLSQDDDGPTDRYRAFCIGPTRGPVQVYESTVHNVKEAIQKRITEKQRPVTLKDQDRVRLGKMVRASMDSHVAHAPFSRERILEWAAAHSDLEELVSKKWSSPRLTNAIKEAKALVTSDWKVPLACSVKVEALTRKEPQKAPRMLLADGDLGQLASLPVISCFEHLLFTKYPDRCIKHKTSEEGVDGIATCLRRLGKGGVMVEGDGTAWDTTCGREIRGIVENPVLRHIGSVLMEVATFPPWWTELAQRLNEEDKLRAVHKKEAAAAQKAPVVAQSCYWLIPAIDAIRRSGHRGTSCLNWWVNFVLWTCALCAEPQKMLNPRAQDVKLWAAPGMSARFGMGFEGDDSLLRLIGAPPGVLEAAEEFWKRAGFNMKLRRVNCVDEGGAVVFIGKTILCDGQGPVPGSWYPELLRNLDAGCWSVSPSAMEALIKGRTAEAESVRYLANMSRAIAFAGRVPEVAHMYRMAAGARPQHVVLPHDCMMRLADLGTDHENCEDVYAERCAVLPRCTRLLELEGLNPTAEESARMLGLGTITPGEDAYAFLPASWCC